MPEPKLRCKSEMTCKTPDAITHLLVHQESRASVGAVCATHAAEFAKNPIPKYILEEIPSSKGDSPLASRPDKPLKMQSKPETPEEQLWEKSPSGVPGPLSPPQPAVAHSPTVEQKGNSNMGNDQMAPSDAVFDEEETSVDYHHEAREERKVMAEEISSNFRCHIGKSQVFEVQFTLRGNYSSEEFRAFAKKLISDQEFLVNAGLRGTVRYAPGVEASVTPPPVQAPTASPTQATTAPPPPPPASTSNGDGKKSGSFICTILAVKTNDTGSTTLGFIPEGESKAFCTYSRKPMGCAGLFDKVPGWTEDHFKTNGTYPCRLRVHWKDSENKSKFGNYFKNAESVEPA